MCWCAEREREKKECKHIARVIYPLRLTVKAFFFFHFIHITKNPKVFFTYSNSRILFDNMVSSMRVIKVFHFQWTQYPSLIEEEKRNKDFYYCHSILFSLTPTAWMLYHISNKLIDFLSLLFLVLLILCYPQEKKLLTNKQNKISMIQLLFINETFFK